MYPFIIVALLILLMMCLFIIYNMVKRNNKNVDSCLENNQKNNRKQEINKPNSVKIENQDFSKYDEESKGNNNETFLMKGECKLQKAENATELFEEQENTRSNSYSEEQNNVTELFEEQENINTKKSKGNIKANETELFEVEYPGFGKEIKSGGKEAAGRASQSNDDVTELFEDEITDKNEFIKGEEKESDFRKGRNLNRETFHIKMICLDDNRTIADRDFDKTLLIGRGEHTDVQLVKERSVSSEHCRIIVENGMFYCVDLSSLNGTYVNGVKLNPGVEREIYSGVLLIIGDLRMRVEFK